MRRTVETPQQLGHLVAELGNVQQPFTITVTLGKDKDRTGAQNRLVHKWYGEIAKQRGDTTTDEVKAECNLQYGVPIMKQTDPDWAAAFGYIFDSLHHSVKLKAIRALDIPFTRRMKVKQLTEYMDQMGRDYRESGFVLTDPEMMKYETR